MSETWHALVIDTNVWLDYFLGFRTGSPAARDLFCAANRAGVDLLYAATSSKDLFYLICSDFKRDYRLRHGSEHAEEGARAASEVAWSCLAVMGEMATAVACDQSDIWLAQKYRGLHEDYEGNLVVAAVQRAHADCLVTNDQGLIRHSPVAALSCVDALAYLDTLGPGRTTRQEARAAEF